MIDRIHHLGWLCRDAEETRAFYEDFLGLSLAAAHVTDMEVDGTPVKALHTAFALGDGALLTFFDVRDRPFEASPASDLDMHIALEVSDEQLDLFLARARETGVPANGPVDHRLARSVYLRDPNGYMVEVIAKSPVHDQIMGFAAQMARPQLAEWQRAKRLEPVAG